MRTINEHKTAILIFALSPDEEMRHKNINKANLLFTALSKHTLDTVQKTGLPYFHLTEKEQVGDSFGERFANAIQFVYDNGYDQVITIGNDSPHLIAQQILKSANSLSVAKVVLGPSMDGGFYLMGMHKSSFNVEHFKNLPWKTPKLKSAFINEFIVGEIELVQLNALHDVDHIKDLKSIISNSIGLPLEIFRILRRIIAQNQFLFKVDWPLMEIYTPDRLHNRGSPILISLHV